MIPRYTPAVFAHLWSTRPSRGVARSGARRLRSDGGGGPRPAGAPRQFDEKKLTLDADASTRSSRRRKHDVIAFLTHVEELAGHRRAMASPRHDVERRARYVVRHSAARRGGDAPRRAATSVLDALATRAREHAKTPMIGRSHGIFAEPVTFGLALAGHHAEIARGASAARRGARRDRGRKDRRRGRHVRASHASDRSAGARASSGSRPKPWPRKSSRAIVTRHSSPRSRSSPRRSSDSRRTCAIGSARRSAEAEEAFTVGQKGSSAMPHKRNPISSENLCGLARVVRAAVVPALENVALWHERDISHSSVERMIAPDATATLGVHARSSGAPRRRARRVPREHEARTWTARKSSIFTEAVLLALVEAGMPRQEAYVLVQRNAMRAFHGEGRLPDSCSAKTRRRRHGSRPAKLERCFDLRARAPLGGRAACAARDRLLNRRWLAPPRRRARSPETSERVPRRARRSASPA